MKGTHKAPLVWVLTDDRAGNVSQCLGLAEQLPFPFFRKEIRYNWMARLPNLILGASPIACTSETKKTLIEPYPDLVIAAGRRTAPVARYIKRMNPTTSLLQLMWPDVAPDEFDLIVLPEHDQRQVTGDHILRLPTAPNRITKRLLEAANKTWEPILAHLKKPRIAVLIGGKTKEHDYDAATYQAFITRVNEIAESLQASLLLTTSRRTPKEVVPLLNSSLTVSNYFYDAHSNAQNPYLGYLACADFFIATGDSVSMCSEVVATGKPLFIFAPPTMTAAKHQRFHQQLYSRGFAKPLDSDVNYWTHQGYNATLEILGHPFFKHYIY